MPGSASTMKVPSGDIVGTPARTSMAVAVASAGMTSSTDAARSARAAAGEASDGDRPAVAAASTSVGAVSYAPNISPPRYGRA